MKIAMVVMTAVFILGCGTESNPDYVSPKMDGSIPTQQKDGKVTKPDTVAPDTLAPDTKPPCVNQCAVGIKQCIGNAVSVCQTQSNGCADWSTPSPCKNTEICSGGACVLSCSNQCSIGQKQCSGNTIQTCKMTSSGCSDWVNTKTCKNTEICSGGSCILNCSNVCSAGQKQCAGSNIVQTCKLQSSGCYNWTTTSTCESNEVCSGGKCVLNCTNQCAAGAKQCSGNSVQTCQMLSSGCLGWSVAVPCKATETCKSGICVPPDSFCSLAGSYTCVLTTTFSSCTWSKVGDVEASWATLKTPLCNEKIRDDDWTTSSGHKAERTSVWTPTSTTTLTVKETIQWYLDGSSVCSVKYKSKCVLDN